MSQKNIKLKNVSVLKGLIKEIQTSLMKKKQILKSILFEANILKVRIWQFSHVSNLMCIHFVTSLYMIYIL